MKKHRLLALFVLTTFILSTTLFSLASCAQETPESNTATTAGGGADQEVSEEATTEERLYANVEAKDYEGHTFTFLSLFNSSADWIDWIPRDLVAEEENGEPINDAVFKRNQIVSEKFNVNFEEVSTTNAKTDMQKSVKSGDDVYDCFVGYFQDTISLAQGGNFLDFNTIPNIDLTQPWWDQNAVKSLSVGFKTYFVTGDIGVMDNDAASAIIFNKKLLKDHNLDSPYDAVKDGKWTLDMLMAMCKDVGRDLNGDGVLDFTDQYGFIDQRDAAVSLFLGSGENLARKDENDHPIFTANSERSYNVVEKVFDLMYQNSSINLHKFEGKYDIYAEQTKLFTEDRALFSWIRMRVVETLRGMESDFGILPIPKYDENQAGYHNMVSKYTGNCFAVPVTAADPARTGAILESLACESVYTLTPAFYGINLQGKYARDEESREMLDIIFSTTVYDIGELYNFGDFGWQLISMTMKDDRNYTSVVEKHLGKIDKDIQKFITAYEKNA